MGATERDNRQSRTTDNHSNEEIIMAKKTTAPKSDKPTQVEKLEANKTKVIERETFINQAATGTLPKLGVVRPNTEALVAAEKVASYVGKWILVLGVQYVAIKNPKFGEGVSMKAHIVNRDGERHQVWLSETLKDIIEKELNDETLAWPSVMMVVRPGKAFIPSRDEPPQDVMDFFSRWIQNNGASFNVPVDEG